MSYLPNRRAERKAGVGATPDPVLLSHRMCATSERVTDNTKHLGLILLGHGSSIDRRSAEPVYRAAERCREHFASVRVAFWKEQPSIADALGEIDADAVIVVPYFMANGWFVMEALPTAIGLEHWPELPCETALGKRVAYTQAVGSHPSVHGTVEALVRGAIGERPAQDIAVAIVGHGTTRSTTSRFSAIEAGDALRATNQFSEVINVFLDDEPGVAEVFQTWSSDVVVVPFMVSDGPHVRVDLVQALGLETVPDFGQVVSAGDKTLTITEPVGASRELMVAVKARIREAADSIGPVNGAALPPCETAVSELLLAANQAPVELGNVVLHADGEAWTLCRSGEAASPEELRELPARAPWRWWRRNSAGGYRPWLSGTDAPDGWIVRGTDRSRLQDLLAVVAPGALMSRHRSVTGSLVPNSFSALAAKQAGPTRAARGFALEELEELVGGICHNCARKVVWRAAKGVAAPRGGGAPSPPCETPCQRLFSEAARRVRAGSY